MVDSVPSAELYADILRNALGREVLRMNRGFLVDLRSGRRAIDVRVQFQCSCMC